MSATDVPVHRMPFLHARWFIASCLVVVLVVIAGGIGYVRLKHSTANYDSTFQQKVSSNAQLRLSFPEPMNQQSILDNLSIDPQIAGEKSWDGPTLVFNPAEKLINGKTYTFLVSRRAQKADGTSLGREIEFRFIVTGAPAVSTHFPADKAEMIPADAKVTLIFDRPMIPLSQVQGAVGEQKLAKWPVTIAPTTAGRWRWMSTTTIEFIPAQGFVPATSYTVSVPVGIASVGGDATDKDFSWTFETQRPKVIATQPTQGYDLAGPGTPLTLQFNLPMDLHSAEQSVTLLRAPLSARNATVPTSNNTTYFNDQYAPIENPAMPEGMQPQTIRALQYGTKDDNGKTVIDRTKLVVVPQEKLAFAQTYVVKVAAGIRAATGVLGSKEEFRYQVSTVGNMEVKDAAYTGDLRLDFSNPLNDDTLKGNITITPIPDGWKDVEWKTNEWGEHRVVNMSASFKPSTSYTLTVSQKVKDQYGQSLKAPYVYTFKTNPLAPEAFIHANGDFGFFEKGKPPVYYLNSVNVSRLDVKFTKLSLQTFIQKHNQWGFGKKYEPDLAADGIGGQYKEWSKQTANKQDTYESKAFDVQKELDRHLESGIYVLSLQAPEYLDADGKPVIAYQFFAMTNIALTLKYSGSSVLIWAVDVRDGSPVTNAQIKLFDVSGNNPYSGTTDKNGFYEVPVDFGKLKTGTYGNGDFWVAAEKDGDFSFVSNNWNEGIQPYQFDGLPTDFRYSGAPKYRLQSTIYTDRNVYRAGDTVKIKGITRLLDWNGVMQLPSKRNTVNVQVLDANSKEIFNKAVPLTDYGSFHVSVPIAKDGSLGYYGVYAKMSEVDVGPYAEGTASFPVLAYHKPEYKVDVTTAAADYFNKDRIEADIVGAYYFGAPMAGAKVQWRAETTDWYFNRYTQGWYSFALQDNWCWYNCTATSGQIAQGSGKLTEDGRMHIALPVNIDDKSVSQVVSIEADVTDQNNQVVSNRVSVPVHKANVYVGVQMEDYGVSPGGKAKVKLITLNTDGSPSKSQSVKVQLFSRVWNSIRKKGVDGQYYFDNQPVDTFVRDMNARTNEEGKTTAEILVDKGGEFRIVATVRDSAGRESKAGASLYAWSSAYVNWPHTNSDRMELVADKQEYAVGDTAKIIVKSPYQGKGVKALITVERENVITKRVIDVTSNAQPVEIPITEDLIPNAYVSVVVVKARQGETFNEKGLDTGTPAFKIGYVRIPVQTARKKITLSLTTDQKSYIPRQKVTVALKAVDWQGKPVKGEFSLSVVDQSVLALTGFELPDLVRQFYAERGLGVMSANMLSYFIERFKPGSKGGGGGAGSEEVKRGTFKDTAYWNPTIITDDSGNASVSFTLPDNLTTWQLLAIGSSREHSFGAMAETIIETKHVIVRPVRPRFAVVGDEVQLGAIVHNFLSSEQAFHVTLSGKGFTQLGSDAKDVTIARDGEVKVVFPVRINAGETAVFDFAARNAQGQDDITETIPLYRFGTPQAVATTNVTDTTVTEKVTVPSKADAPEGTLTATISPSLATYLPSGLAYVLNNPYWCAEQTMSALLPNIALKTLQGFDAFKIVSDKQLSDRVITGVQTLYTFQRGDGGFGYWTDSTLSYPYLSAYILYGLDLAKKAGYTVDAGVMDRTQEYLQGVLRNQNLSLPFDSSVRAYILHVLAERGVADVSLLNNLYDKREKLPLFSKAQLAMALQKANDKQSLSRADALLTEIENQARVDTRGTHFEEENTQSWYGEIMHTNDRTTAIVLQALVRIKPDDVVLPRVVRSMLEARHDGHWDTTQSTSLSLLALTEFLKKTKELDGNFTAGVTVDGKQMMKQAFDQKSILTKQEKTVPLDSLPRGKDIDVTIDKVGKGKLYYDLLLKYFYATDTLPPAEEGISIQRDVTPMISSPANPTVGGTYKVTLTITVPEDRQFVAVNSPHPAGMEGIDLGLKTSQQNLLSNDVNSAPQNANWWSGDYYANGLWRFTHREFRDDSVFLFADYLPAGVYQYQYVLRATTPGHYHWRPARIWEMYFPEVFGQTSGQWFDVKGD